MICKNCGGFCDNDDIFCLNCGYLLKNYETFKIPDLNYDLDDDELLVQVEDEFSKTANQFEVIMSNFSEELDKYNKRVENTSKSVSNGLITYEEHINNISNIFMELSDLFENLIISIKGIILKILNISHLILKSYYKNDGVEFEIESYEGLINSFEGFVESIKSVKSTISSIIISYDDEKFENGKNNVLLSVSKLITLNESFVRELKFIKEKYSNINYMTIEDNHNHFCIYCGAKVESNQNFCSECGKQIYRNEKPVNIVSSKYDETINNLESEYLNKQNKAKELVGKLFDPSHMAYDKFMSSINKSNQLFDNQITVTRKMAELDTDKNDFVEREIEGKIKTLKSFIDKMEDLINELIINMSSNKKDKDDINNLFNDMDDLINSVKDY